MSRLLTIFLGIIIILLPVSILAEEKSNQKSQVKALFKDYKTSLKAGDSEEALKVVKEIYTLTLEAYGENSKTHAVATFNLAQMNDLTNNFAASAKFYRMHFKILDALKIPKDNRYLYKLGLLAEVYYKHSESRAAVKYGHMGLELAKKLELSDAEVGEYELSLGRYYYRIRGKEKRAYEYFNVAYDLFLRSYGRDHFKTAKAEFWRALFLKNRKKYAEAIEKFEYVLSIYKNDLSPEDDRIRYVHSFLRDSYVETGEKEKAMEHTYAALDLQPNMLNQSMLPIIKVAPLYPREAERKGLSGYVVAAFTVDEFGRPKDLRIVETTNEIFNKPSLRAASKFRYEPAVVDGKSVKVENVLHRITFEIVR